MAITTATELETAITNRLGRSDLSSSQVQEFIALGEARINRKLRLLQQHTVATVTLSSGSDTANLPTGFLEQLDMQYSDFDHEITQVPLVALNARKDDVSAQPTHFAVSSTYIFDRLADQAYSFRSTYFKKWDILTDTTNWLLTNVPDLYLYCALVEAAKYIRNTQKQAVWEQSEKDALAEANQLDSRTKRNSRMTHDPALTGRGGRRFNIQAGY